MALCNAEKQYACSNCYADQGSCAGLQDFLNELTALSYKHKITLCVTKESGDCIAAIPMSDEDVRLGPSYVEAIKGSGFIIF
ncbi:hypothetical protein [Acinetobacter soli]|uniref:hypothetical protein n=1 Tax=Acinetobacter soli TaxID=487316 RepID=UPI001ABC32D7|nr:hypothetical protein [Acinetobacter soli]MBO3640300.1 hypothetical protein [Acinetobacter soli]